MLWNFILKCSFKCLLFLFKIVSGFLDVFFFKVLHSECRNVHQASTCTCIVCICRRTELNRWGIITIRKRTYLVKFCIFLFPFEAFWGTFPATDETGVTAVGDKSLTSPKMEKWTSQRRLLVWLITPCSMSTVALFPLRPLPPSHLNLSQILFALPPFSLH